MRFFVYLIVFFGCLGEALYLNVLAQHGAAFVLLALAFALLCVRDVRRTLAEPPFRAPDTDDMDE